MGAGSSPNHDNKRIMKFCFDCVPWTKPIEVITKESGTAPERGEQKAYLYNTVFNLVKVKVRRE